jgi:hypothetical protein
MKVEADDGPEPPRPPMLRPSWLLAGFTLEPGVVLGEQGDFRADIPEGVRVAEEPDDEPPGPVNVPARVASLIARQAARDARSALRSVFGGGRR